MDVTRTTVPGRGTLHHLVTRRGQRFGVLVEDGGRRLLVHDPAEPDAPALGIPLDQDEADQVADLLHSRPVPDRLAELERRVREIAEAAR
ncbi:hypothetical protein [Nonomuraea candida]|uniref:hypothetical protein n=1 Tax=Nonomuraea candida TaxID=359159 RepID=UPI0005B7E49A|nr:hypothetical protein [Nonomuraea candida]